MFHQDDSIHMHVPYPSPYKNETLVEFTLFEDFIGSVNLCSISQTFIQFPRMKDSMALFPNGVINTEDYFGLIGFKRTQQVKLTDPPTHAFKHVPFLNSYMIFTPFYNKGREVVNLHYTKNEMNGELKGNCGIYGHGFEYFDPIHNFLPFFQISSTLLNSFNRLPVRERE